MEIRKYLLLGTLLLVLILLASPTAATTQTLNPTADAHIDSDNPMSNYGGSDWLDIEYYAWDSEYFEDTETRAYLLFDLANIPSEATINSAKLRLYTLMVLQTTKIGVYKCTDTSWTELAITWNNAPSTTGSAIAITTVAVDGTWYEWDVTSLVKSGQKLTLVLKIEEGERAKSPVISFYSRELRNEPELVIDYTTTSAGGGFCLGTILIVCIPLVSSILLVGGIVRRKKRTSL